MRSFGTKEKGEETILQMQIINTQCGYDFLRGC
jgi:hypothetical protein